MHGQGKVKEVQMVSPLQGRPVAETEINFNIQPRTLPHLQQFVNKDKDEVGDNQKPVTESENIVSKDGSIDIKAARQAKLNQVNTGQGQVGIKRPIDDNSDFSGDEPVLVSGEQLSGKQQDQVFKSFEYSKHAQELIQCQLPGRLTCPSETWVNSILGQTSLYCLDKSGDIRTDEVGDVFEIEGTVTRSKVVAAINYKLREQNLAKLIDKYNAQHCDMQVLKRDLLTMVQQQDIVDIVTVAETVNPDLKQITIDNIQILLQTKNITYQPLRGQFKEIGQLTFMRQQKNEMALSSMHCHRGICDEFHISGSTIDETLSLNFILKNRIMKTYNYVDNLPYSVKYEDFIQSVIRLQITDNKQATDFLSVNAYIYRDRQGVSGNSCCALQRPIQYRRGKEILDVVSQSIDNTCVAVGNIAPVVRGYHDGILFTLPYLDTLYYGLPNLIGPDMFSYKCQGRDLVTEILIREHYLAKDQIWQVIVTGFKVMPSYSVLYSPNGFQGQCGLEVLAIALGHYYGTSLDIAKVMSLCSLQQCKHWNLINKAYGTGPNSTIVRSITTAMMALIGSLFQIPIVIVQKGETMDKPCSVLYSTPPQGQDPGEHMVIMMSQDHYSIIQFDPAREPLQRYGIKTVRKIIFQSKPISKQSSDLSLRLNQRTIKQFEDKEWLFERSLNAVPIFTFNCVNDLFVIHQADFGDLSLLKHINNIPYKPMHTFELLTIVGDLSKADVLVPGLNCTADLHSQEHKTFGGYKFEYFDSPKVDSKAVLKPQNQNDHNYLMQEFVQHVIDLYGYRFALNFFLLQHKACPRLGFRGGFPTQQFGAYQTLSCKQAIEHRGLWEILRDIKLVVDDQEYNYADAYCTLVVNGQVGKIPDICLPQAILSWFDKVCAFELNIQDVKMYSHCRTFDNKTLAPLLCKDNQLILGAIDPMAQFIVNNEMRLHSGINYNGVIQANLMGLMITLGDQQCKRISASEFVGSISMCQQVKNSTTAIIDYDAKTVDGSDLVEYLQGKFRQTREGKGQVPVEAVEGYLKKAYGSFGRVPTFDQSKDFIVLKYSYLLVYGCQYGTYLWDATCDTYYNVPMMTAAICGQATGSHNVYRIPTVGRAAALQKLYYQPFYCRDNLIKSKFGMMHWLRVPLSVMLQLKIPIGIVYSTYFAVMVPRGFVQAVFEREVKYCCYDDLSCGQRLTLSALCYNMVYDLDCFKDTYTTINCNRQQAINGPRCMCVNQTTSTITRDIGPVFLIVKDTSLDEMAECMYNGDDRLRPYVCPVPNNNTKIADSLKAYQIETHQGVVTKWSVDSASEYGSIAQHKIFKFEKESIHVQTEDKQPDIVVEIEGKAGKVVLKEGMNVVDELERLNKVVQPTIPIIQAAFDDGTQEAPLFKALVQNADAHDGVQYEPPKEEDLIEQKVDVEKVFQMTEKEKELNESYSLEYRAILIQKLNYVQKDVLIDALIEKYKALGLRYPMYSVEQCNDGQDDEYARNIIDTGIFIDPPQHQVRQLPVPKDHKDCILVYTLHCGKYLPEWVPKDLKVLSRDTYDPFDYDDEHNNITARNYMQYILQKQKRHLKKKVDQRRQENIIIEHYGSSHTEEIDQIEESNEPKFITQQAKAVEKFEASDSDGEPQVQVKESIIEIKPLPMLPSLTSKFDFVQPQQFMRYVLSTICAEQLNEIPKCLCNADLTDSSVRWYLFNVLMSTQRTIVTVLNKQASQGIEEVQIDLGVVYKRMCKQMLIMARCHGDVDITSIYHDDNVKLLARLFVHWFQRAGEDTLATSYMFAIYIACFEMSYVQNDEHYLNEYYPEVIQFYTKPDTKYGLDPGNVKTIILTKVYQTESYKQVQVIKPDDLKVPNENSQQSHLSQYDARSLQDEKITVKEQGKQAQVQVIEPVEVANNKIDNDYVPNIVKVDTKSVGLSVDAQYIYAMDLIREKVVDSYDFNRCTFIKWSDIDVGGKLNDWARFIINQCLAKFDLILLLKQSRQLALQPIINIIIWCMIVTLPTDLVLRCMHNMMIAWVTEDWSIVKDWAICVKLEGLSVMPIYHSQCIYLHNLQGRPDPELEFDWLVEFQHRTRTKDFGPVHERLVTAYGGKDLHDVLRGVIGQQTKVEVPHRRNLRRDVFEKRFAFIPSGAASKAVDPLIPKQLMREISQRHGWSKKYAAALEVDLDDLILKAEEEEMLIEPHIKQNELVKLRPIYPAPLWATICESLAYYNFESSLVINGVDLREDKLESSTRHTQIIQMCMDKELMSSFDFEDFNAQHSFQIMNIILDVVWEYIYLDFDVESIVNLKRIETISRRIITKPRVKIKEYDYIATCGLFSGWRLTSLVNTLCNILYMRAIDSQCKQLYADYQSIKWQLHHGDDYLGLMYSQVDYRRFIECAKWLGVKFNPLKQMFGRGICEYLREMYYPTGEKLRSICRAIGNAVGGNYESEYQYTDVMQVQQNIISIVQRLVARGGSLVRSVRLYYAASSHINVVKKDQITQEKSALIAQHLHDLPGIQDYYEKQITQYNESHDDTHIDYSVMGELAHKFIKNTLGIVWEAGHQLKDIVIDVKYTKTPREQEWMKNKLVVDVMTLAKNELGEHILSGAKRRHQQYDHGQATQELGQTTSSQAEISVIDKEVQHMVFDLPFQIRNQDQQSMVILHKIWVKTGGK